MEPNYKTTAHVIITRPKSQSNGLAQLVEQAGGVAICIPALEISGAEQPHVARTFFDRIDDYHMLIFISPNAVTHSLDYFDVAAIADKTCIAIGASTAQIMEQAGIKCDAYPPQSFTSEAMLELPALADVSGRNILIIRGNGGRALLGDKLIQRGASVDYAEVYQRQVPATSAAGLNAVVRENAADLVIANSVETLSNIVSITEANLLGALQGLQLVTGSTRVAQAAVESGFRKPALLAKGPDDHALMQAISDWSKYSSHASDQSLAAGADDNHSNSGTEVLAQPHLTTPPIAPSINDEQSRLDSKPHAANLTQGDTFKGDQGDNTKEHHDKIDIPHTSATLDTHSVDETRQTNDGTSTERPKIITSDDDSQETKPDSININSKTKLTPKEDTMTEQQQEPEVQPTKTRATGSGEKTQADISSDDAVDRFAKEKAGKQKRSGAGIAWLALLTALLACGGAGWNWWQTHQAVDVEVVELDIPTREDIADQIRQEIDRQSAKIRNTVNQQTDQIESALDKQAEFASSLRTQKRSVESLTDQLTGMENSMSAMRGVSANVRNTWVRAETEYFLQTANTRLQLAGDVKSAIQALKAADERMVALGDPSLTPVRAQLSEELLALESLPTIDVEGIALTLNALSGRVNTLPLLNRAPDNYMSVSKSSNADTNDERGAWQRTKDAFSGALGNVVRYSPTGEDAVALLAPDQVYFLFRNVQMQIQAARIAALQGQQRTYNDSIDAAVEWLETYFDDSDSGVSTMLERLHTLRAEKVTLDLPDISTSLNLVRAKLSSSRTSLSVLPETPSDATNTSDNGITQAPKLAP